MKSRSNGRFAVAFAVAVTLGQLALPRALRLGGHAGAAGMVAALLLAGFAIAVVFTLIYDGPRSTSALLRRTPARPET